MNTELVYMEQGELTEYPTAVQELQGRTTLILPATIFYPQGGGQPYDQGVITGAKGTFRVDEVRNIEGVVHHIGLLEGEMTPGEEVVCQINAERRALNSRLHTAGHVLDMAVHKIGLGWQPGKGYSFPDGPYVEYTAGFEGADLQVVRAQIDQMCADLVEQDLPVHTQFMERAEMEKVLVHVPDHLPENRPARVVFTGDYGIPCGGTHVKRLGEIGTITVRKMKMNGEVLRVSYLVGE